MFLKENVVIKFNNGGKETNKKPLFGVSICAVVLLVLGSLSNVVGYQTVQSSNQQTIKENVSQKELLFQTIVEVANNKEIQRTILKPQMSGGIFQVSDIPVITKNQLKQMYFIGLILSKFHSKSRMQSVIEKYQFSWQEMQKEISAAPLDRQVTQLTNSECDCDNEQMAFWHFPILCTILQYIGLAGFLMTIFGPFPTIGMYMVGICLLLGTILDCYWLDGSQYEIVG
jgi:hypothetical protein